ncbi:uncharacterized protein LAESUDRAFT_730731 [Laetiporus sulphureus 93-53]|uniref:DUF829-domain-containing protein n=1 Tax=Laetiporus sulphureus 93-53 TaxID=1314785 RepID=A0A165C199_9APHY|nr:uncharacterized protein LAESUDRAFT_730731 [Laetiporus sulphureus 93-53]KZT02018.1 hypothetical protein LAESUDRAFT_730731 [Laetiporus sulphureus 93-53]
MTTMSGKLNGSDYLDLNSVVRLYPPNLTEGRNVISMHPSIVLLFGWMDAHPAHLIKYVEGLQSTFPTSHVILIRSTSGFYFTSQKQLERLLIPVVDIIQTEAKNGAIFRGILVHVLSNGGGFQFMTLRKVLRKMPVSQDPTVHCSETPTALVLDSTPGDNGLESSITSMAPSNPILHLLAVPPIAALYSIFYMMNSLRGNSPIFQELRTTLNSPDLLPSITSPLNPKETPRLYVYSERDSITAAPKVAAHIQESVLKGFDVDVEKFLDTQHISHARRDPKRYWGSVQRLWAKAVAAAAGSSMRPSL